MNMESNKAEHFSGENEEIDASECNKKINKYIRFPTLTWEKIIKLIIVTCGTGFMIVTFFTGLGYSRHDVDCYDDMPYYYTESIHNYFYEHEGFCLALKFIISFLIDLLIIYTLIVWSLFGTNVRLISSGCTFFIVNLLCRFLHIQIQPEKSAFTRSHIFSFFVNYQVSTYSFFSVTLGIYIICALEWKRNNARCMYWIMMVIYFIYIIFLIVMRGNYIHEIFTGVVFGHYFFMINEKVLEMIYGKEYVKGEISTNIDIPIGELNESGEKKGNEMKMQESQDNETGEEDNLN